MSDFTFDLKKFREEKLQITQIRLAELIGVRQDTISRYEKTPDQIPIYVLIRLAEAAGMSLDQVIGYQPPVRDELTVERIWMGQHRIAAIQGKIDTLRKETNEFLLPEDKVLLNGLQEMLTARLRKPTISVIGSYSTGKGTLINGLLGKKVIPTGVNLIWAEVPIRIRHVEDRPVSMKDTVYILGTGNNAENLVLASGGMGVFQDWQGSGNGEIKSVLIFEDSDLLKNCDVVKVPGFSVPEDNLDILVYLLPTTGVVGASETLYCKAALESLWMAELSSRNLKPLPNLFFVMSKAHLAGNRADAEKIMAEMGTYIYSTISPSYWEKRALLTGVACNQDTFLSRFFLYSTFEPTWCEVFEQEFCLMAETLPKVFEQVGINAVRDYRDIACKVLDNELPQDGNIPSGGESSYALADQLKINEADGWTTVIQKRDKVVDAMRKCCQKTMDAFCQHYQKTLSEDLPLCQDDVRDRYSSAQLQQIGSRLNSELERQLKQVLSQAGPQIINPLEDYLSAFEARTSGSGFSVREYYLQSLGRQKSIGAMTQEVVVNPELRKIAKETMQKYMSDSQEEVHTEVLEKRESNWIGPLGIATGVTTMGLGLPLSILGTALSVTVGAALATEKPITKSRVYKKISQVYSNEEVLMKYSQCIKRYWDDTIAAFQAASEEMEQGWADYYNRLREDIQRSETSRRAQTVQTLKNFFETLPV